MRRIAIPAGLAAALLPAAASADPGHWAAAGGHDHWIALGALGVAGLLAVAALVRDRRARAGAAEDETEETDGETEQEA